MNTLNALTNSRSVKVSKRTLLSLLMIFAYASESAFGQDTWLKLIGGSSTDVVRGMCQASNGNLILTGQTWSKDGDFGVSGAPNAVVVFCLDSNGAIVWKQFLADKELGGKEGRSVATYPNDDIVVTGYIKSYEGPPAGGNGTGTGKMLVAKLDKQGRTKWTKEYGGEGRVRDTSKCCG